MPATAQQPLADTPTNAGADTYPWLIQGGMGVGVSGWRLARAVARTGQLGVVSGTALDVVLARVLQTGDPGGHARRALAAFPLPELARAALDCYFREDGAAGDTAPMRTTPRLRATGGGQAEVLTVLGNFVEVWLAKEGHEGTVGINYLEKIQLATAPAMFGAILAGADYVCVGAGVPGHIPALATRLARYEPVVSRIRVEGDEEPLDHLFDPRALLAPRQATFAPSRRPARTLAAPAESPSTSSTSASGRHAESTHRTPLLEGQTLPDAALAGHLPGPLRRPKVLAIVSLPVLAAYLARDAATRPDGFVIETSSAGGHSAPPRGPMTLDGAGEPVYGPRDHPDLAKMAALGLPFWLAGGQASPEALAAARAQGAAGVQIGSAFALCEESGMARHLREELLERARAGTLVVRNDPAASPTAFPFKVAELAGTVSDPEVAAARRRVCDLGFLRTPVRGPRGLAYRCAAEPVAAYVRKGGDAAATEGRQCLCNGLLATIGLAQRRPGGRVEPPLVTIGKDLSFLPELSPDASPYTAADVVSWLAAGVRPGPAA
ncbi:nitronate monooxygenase [Streptomyces sp. NBC_00536]|uniref:nitronate monooxygenase n=1 Tax=Streptomyces sp. NBC_00536 TaxID=2975769 RepID=UPI002E8205CD|nr:nitronate monooxygenase [Streptomyces sp. NBC_00536]WUC81382.1 nitronate monooxygenase [Streptomyces sp. NBC_00536]